VQQIELNATEGAGALHAAEKLRGTAVLKGHGFIRADKANQIDRALHAAEKLQGIAFLKRHDFKGCGKLRGTAVLKGHGFIRADKANQIDRGFSPLRDVFEFAQTAPAQDFGRVF
jgi:hypothetical protein